MLLAAYIHTPGMQDGSYRVCHDIWVLDYSHADSGLYRTVHVRNPWRRRPARVAHLYPPNTPYWEDTRTAKGGELSAGYFLFVGGETPGLDRLTRNEQGHAQFFDPHERLWQLIRRAAAIGHWRGADGFWQAQAALFEAIDLLRQAEPVGGCDYRVPEPVNLDAQPAKFSDAVDHYLRQHVGRRVPLAELARHLHVSSSTVTHRYQRETGSSPMQTLLRMRIDAAKGLLLKGERLSDIAEQLGFSDAFHLSRTFHRVTGLSPRAYLQRMRATYRKRNV